MDALGRSMGRRFDILPSLWWLFVAAGTVSIAGGLAAEYHERNRGAHGPFLRLPGAIAVSPSGQIFVYTDARQVRVFNPDGRFVRSWPIRTFEGAVKMAFDAQGNLKVAAVRNRKLYQFDPSGHLLDEETNEAAFHGMPDECFYRADGPLDSVYWIRGKSVVRTEPDGTESTIVPGPPSLLSFFFRFFSPMFFPAYGGVLVALGLYLAYVAP